MQDYISYFSLCYVSLRALKLARGICRIRCFRNKHFRSHVSDNLMGPGGGIFLMKARGDIFLMESEEQFLLNFKKYKSGNFLEEINIFDKLLF